MLLVIFVVNSQVVTAQNIEFTKEDFPNDKAGLKEAKKNISEADNYFDQGHQMYRYALPLYLKANAFNPNNVFLNYRIGVCYLYSEFKQKATAYLERAYKLNPTVGENLHYYLGRAYHFNMDWDKAMKEYQTAKEQTKPDDKNALADIDKKITECRNGKELVKKPAKVIIENVGKEINSPNPDYGAVISADESVLMFTSRRENTTGGGIDMFDQMYFEDIYISTNAGQGTGDKGQVKWTEAKNMGAPINSANRHDASLALSADGQKLFIYLDDMNNGSGNIYECDLKGNEWGKPYKMSSSINTKYHENAASLSADGNTFYFASDKAGGFGNHDIYKTTWNDKTKQWGEAENLGPTINTPYDEQSIFIHPDGKTLYFSSEGHTSMGGYDVFKSVWDKGKKKWSIPENIGYPINTPDNDINFVLSASGEHGYYSSFKPDGYGEKDIYRITFKGDTTVRSAVACILKGTIYDEMTKQPLEADIELMDNTRDETIAIFKSNSATGKYLVSLPGGKNYGIAVKKEGYLFHSENFDIPETFVYKEYVKDVPMKSISVGSKIVLKNIFYDFDKATLRSESTGELERLVKLLNDIPSMKIEISGHTDSKGADDYNMKLSQARAQSVVDYLIQKGIGKNRLTAKGYGKTKPIATNDTDEGRQLNRRTEFEIKSK
ncbi:MAG: OmpA family protein [Bacteroidetes bacterium]|nr:OmpA family protein [Bacteroidota bacterium]